MLLHSVLGVMLFGNNSLIPKIRYTIDSDEKLNKSTDTGFYLISEYENSIYSICNSIMFVISVNNGNYVSQFVIKYDGSAFARTKWGNKWWNWKQL